MRPVRILLVIMVVVSVFISCTQKGTDPGNQVPYSDLMKTLLAGSWQRTGGTGQIYLTTSSPQKANDFYSECNGSITISGAVTGSMTYMIAMSYMGSDFIIVTNQPTDDMSSYPVYQLTIMKEGSQSEIELTAETTDQQDYTFTATTLNYSYNSASRTLTISSGTLTGEGGATVTLNGSLTYNTVSIPANIETKIVDMPADDYSVIIEFDSSGVYREIEPGWPDTTYGTWWVEGTDIVIVKDDYGTPETTKVQVRVTGSTLTITSVGHAEDFIDVGSGNPLTIYELMFGLETGSLTDIRVVETTTYTRVQATVKAKAAGITDARPDNRPLLFRKLLRALGIRT